MLRVPFVTSKSKLRKWSTPVTYRFACTICADLRLEEEDNYRDEITRHDKQISREGVYSSKVKRFGRTNWNKREREKRKKRKKKKERKEKNKGKWWSDRDANLTAYLGRMSEPCRIKDPMVNHMQLSSLKRFSRWSGFLLHGWGLYHSYGVNLNWSTLDNSLNPFQIGCASIFHSGFVRHLRMKINRVDSGEKEVGWNATSRQVCNYDYPRVRTCLPFLRLCISDLTLLSFASPDYRVRLEQSTVKLESLSLPSTERERERDSSRRKLNEKKKEATNRNLYDTSFFKRISISFGT